jgi:hypothetical protein
VLLASNVLNSQILSIYIPPSLTEFVPCHKPWKSLLSLLLLCGYYLYFLLFLFFVFYFYLSFSFLFYLSFSCCFSHKLNLYLCDRYKCIYIFIYIPSPPIPTPYPNLLHLYISFALLSLIYYII